MRILVTNWHLGLVGGVESYLVSLLPELIRSGHEVGVLHGHRHEGASGTITAANDLSTWCLEDHDISGLMESVSSWKPDIVYVHGVESVALEHAILDRFPCVLFVHDYSRTCPTGRKCHTFPTKQVCARRAGPVCLLLHYTRRCGGLSPFTMLQDYARQSQRLDCVSRYQVVIAGSSWMHEELSRHGVDANRLRLIPLPATKLTPDPQPPAPRVPRGKMFFLGRFVDLKGVDCLLDALPEAERMLGCPLHLTLAGAGPEKSGLRSKAEKRKLNVTFAGWVNLEEQLALMREADLLAVPSIWPEPFGLVGIEAGCVGLPAVAYAVGGIPDWLIPGCSGELAPAPQTSQGLAEAIARALSSPEHYQRLRRGAWEVSRQFTMAAHIEALETELMRVAGASVSSTVHSY